MFSCVGRLKHIFLEARRFLPLGGSDYLSKLIGYLHLIRLGKILWIKKGKTRWAPRAIFSILRSVPLCRFNQWQTGSLTALSSSSGNRFVYVISSCLSEPGAPIRDI